MDPHPSRTVGFPRESGTDRRTILTPALVQALTGAGFDVLAEPGIGRGIFLDDDAYKQAGVRLAEPDEVWAAPLILRYKSPDPADLARLRPGQHIGALFHAEGDPQLLTALTTSRANAWSYGFLSEDGCFPSAGPAGTSPASRRSWPARRRCSTRRAGACSSAASPTSTLRPSS